MKNMYVYIMSNKPNGTLYIGVTNNLIRRVYEHKNSLVPGFTSKYKLYNLVYFECFDDEETAIKREKTLKGWLRKKKIELIIRTNPSWSDLSGSLV